VKPARGCNEKQLLTPDQEREARRMLAAGAGHRDVAQAIGVTYRRLLTRFEDQLADAKVGRGRGGGPRRHADPTPEEIAVVTAGIRRNWSDERWGIGLPAQGRATPGAGAAACQNGSPTMPQDGRSPPRPTTDTPPPAATRGCFGRITKSTLASRCERPASA
jgi:hypothetical protein